ncbi:MAG: TrkH family potassium uptake protein [Clostridia bacterium]|nr:TrkH family potassium uptake protein [Clostridia bacterium]
MNRKVVLYTVGRIIILEGLLLLIPLAVSLYYRESVTATAFAVTVLAALVIGAVLMVFTRRGDRTMFAKGGFITVALSWVALSLIGALPFWISREIPSYIDAVFETVSGLTTTGASILSNPELLSRGLLFWRSFTHWIGGMGVIVLMLAVMPTESGRSIHILRAEVPGPVVGKLVPRLRDTAKILYVIYLVLTVVEVVFLLCGGMPLFDSILHAFGTAGTGGFGIKADSLGSYSPYLQWVITAFMLLFGVNFNLYYFLLLRRVKSVFKSSELWCYLAIVAVATGVIVGNVLPLYKTFSEAFRHSMFQVSSIITTTGYSTTNFTVWPELSKSVLLILMLIGGCAGSTAGGLKIARVMLLFKTVGRDLKKMLHPRSVGVVQVSGKPVDEQTLAGASSYFVLYVVLMIVIFFVLSFEPAMSLEANLSAAVSCFNNIGPGFAEISSNFAGYSDVSTVVLTLAMLFGRLEIYPILFALTPSVWGKKG